MGQRLTKFAISAVRQFNEGADHAREELLSDNYHIYQDDTSFTYNIVLTRLDTAGVNIDKVMLRVRCTLQLTHRLH